MKVVRRHTVANAPTPPRVLKHRRSSDVSIHYEPVYVTSSSSVYIGSDPSEQSDGDSSSYYYWSSVYSQYVNENNQNYQRPSLRSIFYEGSTDELQEMSVWMEAEGEDEGDEHHYEPLYDCVQDPQPDRISSCSQPTDSFDEDSFDSDFEDPYETQTSVGTSTIVNGHSPSFTPADPATGMTRIRETAEKKIRKFRRSWSVTKSDISSKINKMRKKSVVADGKPGKTTQEVQTPSQKKGKVRDAKDEGSRTWSLKGKFRKNRTSLSQVVKTPSCSKKESATFYLTLTIQPDSSEGSDLSNWKSDTDSIQSSNTYSPATSNDSAAPPTKLKSRPSSASIQRPKIAPPDPPTGQPPVRPKRHSDASEKPSINGDFPKVETEEEKIEDREQFNQRLNNILASNLNGNVRQSDPNSSPPCENGITDKEKLKQKLNIILANQSDKLNNLGNLSKHSSQCSIDNLTYYKGQTNSGVGLSKHSMSFNQSNCNLDRVISKRDLLSRSVSSKDMFHRNDTNKKIFVRSHSSSEILSENEVVNYSDVLLSDIPISLRGSDGFNMDYYNQFYEGDGEEPTYLSSHFADEPLYQFYTATIIQRNAGCSDDEDGYEVIEEIELSERSRPSAMELVGPHGPQRTLWCELKEVQESGILDKITQEKKKLQEAVFELLTSEASYLKSLHVLVTHFINSPKLLSILSKRDWHILFSDIIPVKEASEKLMSDLEARWQQSVYIDNISDILHEHASKNFEVYVKYCSNQVYQDRLLNELKTNNPEFVEIVKSLESHPVTQSLSMHSFLMLPMQRITRLPLLVDAIYHRLEQDSNYLETTKLALSALNKVVHECNEGARKMERMQEMLLLSRQLDWGEVKVLPLISASRWLVKRGEVTQLVYQSSDTYLRTPKFRKTTLHLFLFTDLLVVTKKKTHEEERYLVLDHCPRNMVHVTEAGVGLADLPTGAINLMMLTMLCNRQEKTREILLSCPLESERSRWIEAVTPRQSDNPEEVVYEDWDCPQVQAIHSYTPEQPDELALNQGDVVKVLKKTADGWYQGERLPDGVTGWFPGNYCKEISSAHVRARYLHQRYRLLQLSESFLEQKSREDEKSSRRRQSLQLSFGPGSKRLGEKKKKMSLGDLGLMPEYKSINGESRKDFFACTTGESWKQRVPV